MLNYPLKDVSFVKTISIIGDWKLTQIEKSTRDLKENDIWFLAALLKKCEEGIEFYLTSGK